MRPQNSILLVEDDPVDVMSVRRAFEENRVTNPLFVAGDGEEGLAFLLHEGKFSEQGSSPIPSLILMDLKMPRMGGLELLSIIKGDNNLCHIPVVILTTSSEKSDVLQGFQNGVAGYLLKPVTFEKFVSAIRTFDLYWTLSELP